MSRTSTTPTSSSRLVSKLSVVGEARVDPNSPQQSGASLTIALRVAVPLLSGSASYPLFSDEGFSLRSSHLVALTPSSSVALGPIPPSPVILEAAKRLRISTTGSPASAFSPTLGRQPRVSVSVQDFNVCLIAEGGSGADGYGMPSSFGGRSSPRKGDLSNSSSSVGSSGRRSSFSPAVHDGDSASWLVVLEVWVPCSTFAPLDCYSITMPLPRCLSNTLAFRLDPDPSTEGQDFAIATTPRLLTAPSASSEEDLIEGTFQSTQALEIRWADVELVPPLEEGSRTKRAMLDQARASLSLTLGASDAQKEGMQEVVVEYELWVEPHHAGVESTAFIELAAALPSNAPQSIEWLTRPSITVSRGLTSTDYISPRPTSVNEAADSSFASSSTSVNRNSPSASPTPAHRLPQSHPTSSLSATHSSSSSASLLRQQLPSLHASTSELSFAFDGSPSPASSPPVPRVSSPLSLRSHAGDVLESWQNARSFRLHLDLSQIRKGDASDPFSIKLQGTVLAKSSVDGSIAPLPLFFPSKTSSVCSVSVDNSASPSTRIITPPHISSNRSKQWRIGLPAISDPLTSLPDDLPFFSLASPAIAAQATVSRRRRMSIISNAFHETMPSMAEMSPPLDLGRPRSLPKVEVEILVVLGAEDRSSAAISEKGKGRELGRSWQECSKLRVTVPPSALSENALEPFEFAVVASEPSSITEGSVRTTRRLDVLCASFDGVLVHCTVDDAPLSPSPITSSVGYVQVHLGDLRSLGGVLEVSYAVECSVAAPAKRRTATRDLVHVGSPVFDSLVRWQEMKVSVVQGFDLSVARSTSTIAQSAQSSVSTIQSNVEPLSDPSISVLLSSSARSPPSPARSSILTLSNLPFVALILWLVISMGTEVRQLRAGLIGMAEATRSEGLRLADLVQRVDATLAQSIFPIPYSPPPPFASAPSQPPPRPSPFSDRVDDADEPAPPTVEEDSTLLRPSFTSVPRPPPPPPPPPPTPPFIAHPTLLDRPATPEHQVGPPLRGYHLSITFFHDVADALDNFTTHHPLGRGLGALARWLRWSILG